MASKKNSLRASIDATGLSVTRYEGRWFTTPHGTRQRQGFWLKLHAIIENESKAFIAWAFTGPDVHDTNLLERLVEEIEHPVHALYADAGYLSSRNCTAVVHAGGTPYIRPKKSRDGGSHKHVTDRRYRSRAFQGMLDAFARDPETWLKEYRQRNRIESTFGAVKQRFGGRLGSVHRRMVEIEAHLKLIARNLTRVRKRDF